MSAQWFARVAGGEQGPISSSELLLQAQNGTLKPDTLVRNGQTGRWIRADRVRGLFKLGKSLSDAQQDATTTSRSNPVSQDRRQSQVMRHRSVVLYFVLCLSVCGNVLFGIWFLISGARSTNTAVVHSQLTARPNRPTALLPVHLEPIEQHEHAADLKAPEEVVRAYLDAETWPERLPFVLNPQEVRPRMAAHYGQASTPMADLSKATISLVSGQTVGKDGTAEVLVNIADALPDSIATNWAFVLKQTAAGYRIDWDLSHARSTELEIQAERNALALGTANLFFQPLRLSEDDNRAYLDFRITNESEKTLDYWSADIEIFGADGKSLGTAFTNQRPHRSKEAVTDKLSFDRIAADAIRSWKIRIGDLTLQLPGDRTKDATKFFTVRQPEAIKDSRIFQRDALVGGWHQPGKTSICINAVGTLAWDVLYSYRLTEIDFEHSVTKLRLRGSGGSQIEVGCEISPDAQTMLMSTTATNSGGRWSEITNEMRQQQPDAFAIGKWLRAEIVPGVQPDQQLRQAADALVRATKVTEVANHWDPLAYRQLTYAVAACFARAEESDVEASVDHTSHLEGLSLAQAGLSIARKFDAAMQLLPGRIDHQKALEKEIGKIKKDIAAKKGSTRSSDPDELRVKVKEANQLIAKNRSSLKAWKDGLIEAGPESLDPDVIGILDRYPVSRIKVDGSSEQWINAADSIQFLLSAAIKQTKT